MKPKRKRPKRFRRKVLWTPELLSRIETLRKANPTWGRWPIWLTLCKEGFKISERTVGRMLAYLEEHGRVERVASFLARTRRDSAKRRVKRPYAKRKPKAYEVQRPGDLVQVDTLTPPRHGGAVGPGEVVRHFSAIDLFSRFSLAVVHRRATANRAAGFLRELVLRVPFTIRAIQVDGGSEFMAEFEAACQGLGIELFVLPPRSPKLNGHVETLPSPNEVRGADAADLSG